MSAWQATNSMYVRVAGGGGKKGFGEVAVNGGGREVR